MMPHHRILYQHHFLGIGLYITKLKELYLSWLTCSCVWTQMHSHSNTFTFHYVAHHHIQTAPLFSNIIKYVKTMSDKFLTCIFLPKRLNKVGERQTNKEETKYIYKDTNKQFTKSRRFGNKENFCGSNVTIGY